MEAHFYNVSVTWDKDRKGMMCSPELEIDGSTDSCIEVATPPQFPKGIPKIWSPEHLFTAAVSSCFMTTFLSIAENSNLEFKSFTCDSSGKLDQVDGKFQMTEVLIEPILTIIKEEDRKKALRVLSKTEEACLITNSIKSKVTMKPFVNVASKSEPQPKN
ncbi:MAG: osmotically inducible protein OsmC [Marivirga sp.]|nr:osmotically inducible protein OsmC [Marivirga sp.]